MLMLVLAGMWIRWTTGRASPRPPCADVRKAAEAKDVTRSVEFHQRIHPAERRDVRDRIVVDDPVAPSSRRSRIPSRRVDSSIKRCCVACPHSPCRQIAGRSRADRTSTDTDI